MADGDVAQRVRELRAQGLSPREIARSLGIRTAEASAIVREIAAERDSANPDADLLGCWLNAGWSVGLGVPGDRADWHDPGVDEGTEGLLTVLVARRRRHRRKITTCTYLVDAYCLGVKNAMGPDEMDDRGLRALSGFVFGAYSAPPVSAPIDLVRDLVLGAAEYARGLGFEPHPDFERARLHLGPWEGQSAIDFGCNGKPYYINGPDDDPDLVLRTLRRTAGDGGFRHTVAYDLGDLRMAG
jgi:transcriptional regulator with XRE-family HTH domain